MLILNLAGTKAMQCEKSFMHKEEIATVPAKVITTPAAQGESRYCLKDRKVRYLEISNLPRCYVSMERYAFNPCHHKPGESFNTFYADFSVLSQTCAFEELRDNLT
jgi:hypothetical protein